MLLDALVSFEFNPNLWCDSVLRSLFAEKFEKMKQQRFGSFFGFLYTLNDHRTMKTNYERRRLYMCAPIKQTEATTTNVANGLCVDEKRETQTQSNCSCHCVTKTNTTPHAHSIESFWYFCRARAHLPQTPSSLLSSRCVCKCMHTTFVLFRSVVSHRIYLFFLFLLIVIFIV